jgi:hypothetical protein
VAWAHSNDDARIAFDGLQIGFLRATGPAIEWANLIPTSLPLATAA